MVITSNANAITKIISEVDAEIMLSYSCFIISVEVFVFLLVKSRTWDNYETGKADSCTHQDKSFTLQASESTTYEASGYNFAIHVYKW